MVGLWFFQMKKIRINIVVHNFNYSWVLGVKLSIIVEYNLYNIQK